MFERITLTLHHLRHGATSRVEDEEGATAVEYGLLVALIAAVIVVTVGLLGTAINDAFNTILTELT